MKKNKRILCVSFKKIREKEVVQKIAVKEKQTSKRLSRFWINKDFIK
jgi:hypothetical protein